VKSSVGGEVRWRVALHAEIGALCQTAKASYARFLALVPDRLRLARGDSITTVQVPVAVDPALVRLAADAFADPSLPIAGPIASDPRRILRLAQLDADIDLFWLDRWYAVHGSELIRRLAQVYNKGFDEVGHGEGGEETAYLVHLTVVDILRQAVLTVAHERRSAMATLASTIIDVAMQAALEPAGKPRDNLPARLGLQFSATLSPIALGAAASELGPRALHAYRTLPAAIELGSRVFRTNVELIDVAEVQSTFKERLRRDPASQTALTRQILLEMIRDCALVLLLQNPAVGNASTALRSIASSERWLTAVVDQDGQRKEVLSLIKQAPFAGQKPAATLTGLLERTSKVLAGETSLLGAHGNLTERADLAAAGGIALCLDQIGATVGDEIRQIISAVPAESIALAHLEGRCYRISWDEAPLYRTPKDTRQAMMFVDTSDLAARFLDTQADAALTNAKELLYAPLFGLANGLAGPEQAGLRVCRFAEDGVAFEGDVVALVHLALGAMRLVDGSNAARDAGVTDALGGTTSRQAAIDAELTEMDGRLNDLEKALHATPAEAKKNLLNVEHQSLVQQRGALTKTRDRVAQRATGRHLDVGVFLTLGEPALRVDAPLGGLSTFVNGALLAATGGSRRSAPIADERLRALETAKRTKPGSRPSFVSRFTFRRYALRDSTATPHTEVHNVGCGLTREVLDAYRKERRGVLDFEEVRLSSVDFDQAFRDAFIFESPNEELVLARREGESRPMLVFRRVGRVDVGPPGVEHSVDTWELIDGGAPFVEALFQRVGVHGKHG